MARFPSRPPQTGSIRIIGGEWRGRKLAVPQAPGLRPTADRVRETLFNWLQFDLPGARVADLFAGTGALGLECLSRGAAHVSFCERDPALAGNLRAMLQTLAATDRAQVHAGDVRNLLPSWLGSGQAFDLILLDPPFDAHLHAEILPHCAAISSERAQLYVEAPIHESIVLPSPWHVHREGTTRDVRYLLCRKAP